jgi:hypothetical protein
MPQPCSGGSDDPASYVPRATPPPLEAAHLMDAPEERPTLDDTRSGGPCLPTARTLRRFAPHPHAPRGAPALPRTLETLGLDAVGVVGRLETRPVDARAKPSTSGIHLHSARTGRAGCAPEVQRVLAQLCTSIYRARARTVGPGGMETPRMDAYVAKSMSTPARSESHAEAVPVVVAEPFFVRYRVCTTAARAADADVHVLEVTCVTRWVRRMHVACMSDACRLPSSCGSAFLQGAGRAARSQLHVGRRTGRA